MGGACQPLGQNHSDVFFLYIYILNENQALSVGHLEHFVKLHSQFDLSLKLRGTHIVTTPWSGPGCFPREFKEESPPIPSDTGVASHGSDFAGFTLCFACRTSTVLGFQWPNPFPQPHPDPQTRLCSVP